VNKIARFVIWICSKFNKAEVVQIINGLQQVLAERNPEIKFKDDFKEKHPNYRDYYVDPLPPLTEKPAGESPLPALDWQELLKGYEQREGRPLRPIKPRKGFSVPTQCQCVHCGAPAQYLYYNDGKRKSQLRCKVCGLFFSIAPTSSPNQTDQVFLSLLP
jgi:rubredoxin